MSNVFVAAGTSFITAPTLGNITGSTVRVEQYIDVSTNGVGYLLGQAPFSNTQREFGLYITDVTAGNPRTIDFAFGGSLKTIGHVTAIFGTATPKGVFEFEYSKATGNWFLKLDGVVKANGNLATTALRVDGTRWRIGARSADNTAGSVSGGYIAPAGWKFGDQKIWIDDVLVRHYEMPSSGTTIPELVSGAAGTLQNPTGNDFAVQDAIIDTTPDAGALGAVLGAPLNTLTECANVITIAGVTPGVNVAIAPAAGTEYQISTDAGATYGAWTSVAGNVQLGHRVKARKLTSAYNSATVTASLTIGGVVFSGKISTVANASPYAIKNIVVIGASIEDEPYGRNLAVPNAAGTAALVAAGVNGVNLYGFGWSGFTAAQLVSKIAEAVAAFPNNDTIFLCHPFGNDVSATRPFATMTAGEITAFQNNVTNCMAACGAARNRFYFVGISFRSYANPRTDKTIFNDQTLGSLPYYNYFIKPFMQAHELNTDGFPVFDYYNFFRNECETVLGDDGIHPLDPAGRNRIRQFVAERAKPIIVNGVKPAVIVPASTGVGGGEQPTNPTPYRPKMRIPSEQNVVINSASKTVLLNSDYAFTQVTLRGRNTGVITATYRPLLDDNRESNFTDDDFELISGGVINLADNPRKRTFPIENRRVTAIRFADAGAGEVKCHIRQWGRISA